MERDCELSGQGSSDRAALRARTGIAGTTACGKTHRVRGGNEGGTGCMGRGQSHSRSLPVDQAWNERQPCNDRESIREGLAEMARLREQMLGLRNDVRTSLEILRQSLYGLQGDLKDASLPREIAPGQGCWSRNTRPITSLVCCVWIPGARPVKGSRAPGFFSRHPHN